jgi:hypothetical protein
MALSGIVMKVPMKEKVATSIPDDDIQVLASRNKCCYSEKIVG